MPGLKSFLFERYGGFRDKRIKDLRRDEPIAVDGSGSLRKRELKDYGWICDINANVVSHKEIRVSLMGNAPIGLEVRQWANQNNATITILEETPTYRRANLEFSILLEDTRSILDLATAIEAIVGKGRIYPEKSYKYVCPEVARHLRRFVATIEEYKRIATPDDQYRL